MHMKSNRFSWLFLVLVPFIMLVLAPAAQAAGRFAPLPPPGGKYTVRVNDTLWDIATRYGMTVAQLTAANPDVTPEALRPGQILTIPSKTSSVSDAPSTAKPNDTLPVSALYTVRPDDTLWDIAANYGLYINDLLAANPGVDPRRLMAGQQLFIPGLTQELLSATMAAQAAVAPAPAPVAPPAPLPTTQGLSPDLAPWAQEMVNQINEKRVAGGLLVLAWNNDLGAAAQGHAEDCAHRNRGSHVGSDGARLGARLQRASYTPSWSGENWANARSVARAMEMWWNEPPGADPHVQNIMARRATEIGIGVAKGAWGYYFIADFGSR